MSVAERLRREARCHPHAADALVSVVLLVTVMMPGSPHRIRIDGPASVVAVVVEVLVFCLLVIRSIRPVLVLLLTSVGSWFVVALTQAWSPVTIAVVAAAYTVAVRTDRRIAVKVALLVGPVMVLVAAALSGDWTDPKFLSLLGWIGCSAALGDAVRSRRAYIAAIEERVRRAEHSQEEVARRRVVEERLRIARELHDVVAHHIAVIHVQAGVAGHVLAEQPEAAQQALTHIRRSSQTVLDELGGLLSVLRQPGDPAPLPTDPAPSLGQLVPLINSFEASGLQVQWQLHGTPQPLPSAVDLVAYRLVQEGLTNAHKHGTGSASLGVTFETNAVAIDIVNPSAVTGSDPAANLTTNSTTDLTTELAAGPAAELTAGSMDPADGAGTATARAGGGLGLIGMRERARAVGGSIRAAADGEGSWRVTARLPLAGT
jgi:signal transduction histidine kinase